MLPLLFLFTFFIVFISIDIDELLFLSPVDDDFTSSMEIFRSFISLILFLSSLGDFASFNDSSELFLFSFTWILS
jgi:hypothetical protein